MRQFLLIPHLKIQNANAMSSPYTIGFPAMTAWFGAIHALQRRLSAQDTFNNIQFSKMGISCHEFDLQTYKGPRDFVHSIIGTANPLNKDGSRPSFVEEARCHLEVSLLVEYIGLDPDTLDFFLEAINKNLLCMKFASGDVLGLRPSEIISVDEDNEQDIRKMFRKLMLGHVLIERRDLMIKAMKEEGKDALDALLDHIKVMHRSQQDEDGNVTWTTRRKEAGWIVPIAVGFQGISELGKAKNQRDPKVPHRFAESVLTLGEFVMPHRLKKLDDVLWCYDVNLEKNLYLCVQDKNKTENLY